MRNRKQRGVFLLLLLVLLTQGLALADGDGSGGGSGTPLHMDASQPADGVAEIELQPVIACKFTHNVAMGPHAVDNLSHLSLETADGIQVPAEAFVEDAQLDFAQRRFLYLRPVAPLEPGTAYVVRLTPGIRAKNGMETAEEQRICFTTQLLPVTAEPIPTAEPSAAIEPTITAEPESAPVVTELPVTAEPSWETGAVTTAVPTAAPAVLPTPATVPERTMAPLPLSSPATAETAVPPSPAPSSAPTPAPTPEPPVPSEIPETSEQGGADLTAVAVVVLLLAGTAIGVAVWRKRR